MRDSVSQSVSQSASKVFFIKPNTHKAIKRKNRYKLHDINQQLTKNNENELNKKVKKTLFRTRQKVSLHYNLVALYLMFEKDV